MKKSIILMSVIFVGLIIFSCKDDSPSASKKELLTKNTWLVKSKIIVPAFTLGGMTISDITILDSDEVKKYSFKYDLDGTMKEYDNLGKMIFQTNWSFNTDETQLTHTPGIAYNYPVVGDMSLNTLNIESISSNQIVALVPYSYDGTNYMVTMTFIAK